MIRWLILPLVLLLVGTADLAARGPEPLSILSGGAEHRFTVELALTPEQQMRGLMGRERLGADQGMLFDFGDAQPISMWMKDTLIPLDMIFIGADGRIAGIAQRRAPMSTAVISSPGPVWAVLEVNGGTAERLGLKAGDQVRCRQLGR